MAKPLKIVQFKLQSVVARGLREGKNPQQIAEDCSKAAKQSISNMAVRRYIEEMESSVAVEPASKKIPMRQKREAVVADPLKVAQLVGRDIDMIELQFRTTQALAERFEYICALPDTFEERMKQLNATLKEEGTDTTTLDHWGLGFTLELRRNIGNMAALNREIRQNLQFMATLKEKAFEFRLVEEFIELYTNIFKELSPEIHEVAIQKLAANPRLERIVEQQQQMRGYDQE